MSPIVCIGLDFILRTPAITKDHHGAEGHSWGIVIRRAATIPNSNATRYASYRSGGGFRCRMMLQEQINAASKNRNVSNAHPRCH